MAGRFPRVLIALSLSLAWAAQAQDQGPSATPAVPDESAAGMDPAEITEAPDVTTGRAGTTSGITGADMDEQDQGSGSGQTQADELFQTPAAGAHAGPAYEVETPERADEGDPETLPDAPIGADDSGRREDGEPQASTDQSP
ncbi:hypothetical protein [Halomonas sp. E19]|uniref:hypothetical protein n=1 Tax=unclassified Halomonas TaxID=2609666 RepID=UPI0040334623